jgi:hypothetical protein
MPIKKLISCVDLLHQKMQVSTCICKITQVGEWVSGALAVFVVLIGLPGPDKTRARLARVLMSHLPKTIAWLKTACFTRLSSLDDTACVGILAYNIVLRTI